MTKAVSVTARPPGPLSRLGLSIVAVVVVIDQLSKAVAEAKLAYQQFIELLPILALYRVHNTGIAFSLGHGFDSLLLVGGTALITLVVLYLWSTAIEGGRIVAIGFALITGGAIGNLIDRIRFGYVVDFLYLHLGDRGLFVFNLADVALTIGPILLAWHYLLGGRKA
ncbi:signal peptidase II [Kaistia soli DSM 19436]|uniref:Lipoprotein signal peptidase n=1 Tax=Kaistia soli DSM 19436 TaxID=1122133 RepID=A0A1M5P3V1_9HYPH|nr:signal peptidase II [Kaistia soli]SHG96496.1 signal peptidase II [Kaistia soli DSM 19436]